jgi:hypothetical protein
MRKKVEISSLKGISEMEQLLFNNLKNKAGKTAFLLTKTKYKKKIKREEKTY